ncbi:RidA family protein [Mesorhizobium sp. M1312]|uniref:RidA family protein n=1 Tax=unclassified Mesorhizobium TaxID=325217 RepID=UPI0033350883
MSERRPKLFTPDNCPLTMGYSQIAVVSAGKLAFISGQVGIDAQWRLAPTCQEQTERAFANLKAAVEACGGTMANVCKLTIFIVGNVEEGTYSTVRDSYFEGQVNLPASTFIRVAGLYRPEALIEIEAVVAIPE